MTKTLCLLHGILCVEQPETIVHLLDGRDSFAYNYNISVVNVEHGENGEQIIHADAGENTVEMFQYDSIELQGKLSQNGIIKALLEAEFPADIQSKLVNDYNAAKEKVLPLTAKSGYVEFLNRRKAIKEMVETDCIELPNE